MSYDDYIVCADIQMTLRVTTPIIYARYIELAYGAIG